MSAESGSPPRKRLKAAHLACAALAILVSVALVVVPQRGHPPPLVLVPVILLAWPLGHVLIWGLGWLADKGRLGAAHTGVSPAHWPVVLMIALVGTGAGSLVGLVQLLGSAVQRRWYPYPESGLWGGMLLVWCVHGLCLVGLLLRRPWSRPLSAAIASGWAVLMGAQVAEHMGQAARAGVAELLLAIGVMVALVVLAVSVVASHASKSFLNR